MDTTPAQLANPPANDPPVAAAPPDLSRRFTILDLFVLLVMNGVGIWSVQWMQGILRVAWNYVGTAPWPTYATPNERYLLGSLLGILASCPLVLGRQVYRGRRAKLATGEWLWLLSAGGLAGLVIVASTCNQGIAYLTMGVYFLFQLALCCVAVRAVLKKCFGELDIAWTEVAGVLACFGFAYAMYYGFFVGTIDGGMLSTD